MKNYLKIGLLSLVIVVFSATDTLAKRVINGSGDVKKETRKVRSFNALDISSAFEVELTQGNSESLVIEADDNVLPHIYAKIIGGKLKIYLKDRVRRVKQMKLYITFKNLKEIETSGAVELKGMNKMKFDELMFDASGASEVEMEFSANIVKLDLSGASEFDFTGFANSLNIDASGASEINAINFEVKDCYIDASGASEIKVNVSNKLEVEASGATSVRYKGSPSVDIDTSGVSNVRRY